MTSLSRWNNNRDPDDEPEPPYWQFMQLNQTTDGQMYKGEA